MRVLSNYLFKMPKPLREHNAEPLDPHETVSFYLKDGQCIQLIFRDTDTGDHDLFKGSKVQQIYSMQ